MPCKNKDFCEITLITQKEKTLKFSQQIKSDKTSCIIMQNLNYFD